MAAPSSDRSLAEYGLFDPSVLVSPWDYYRRLRREAPVHRDEQTGIFLVSTYELVLEALRQPEVFSNRFAAAMGGRGSVPEEVLEVAKEGYPLVDTMLTADPPEHKRFRGLVNKAFTPRRVARLEPRMEKIATELIDVFADRGRVELIDEYSVPLPLTVIAEQLGVPNEDLRRFRRWTEGFIDQLGLMGDLETQKEAARRIVEFQHYFAAKLEERRQEPCDDMISDIVNATVEGERPLDVAECLSILQQLLVAGHETTSSAIAEGMCLLATHPAEREKVRGRPELIGNLIEEVLRLATPTANMWRVVKSDTELGGVSLPAGAIALLRFASANRDEAKFPDPDRFDVERENAAEHVAFGHGIHFCIGAMLARKEMEVSFRLLLERLGDFRLAEGEPLEHKPNILLHGLKALHLEW